MSSNIEIKAVVRDFALMQRQVETLTDTPVEIIPQVDTFFNVERGRLKLRMLAADHGQLIYYERPEQDGPKRSDYHIAETFDPVALKKVLSSAYGIRGSVKKTRYLYMVGQTRIHLDDVDDLGQFMELEVVMSEGQSDAEGQCIAEDLMQKLGVAQEDLVEGAYMDLIEGSNPR